MNDLFHDIRFDDTESDLKLRFFMERCLPQDIATDDIKLKTHLMIARQRHRRGMIRTLTFGIAACLAIVLLIVMPFEKKAQKVSHVMDTEKVEKADKTNRPDIRKIKVPVGKTLTMLLPDGTKVVANSRTEIAYPATFQGRTREINVNGEAYLEVAHDRQHPFIVHGNGFSLKVLGTKFNVNTYKGKESSVALLEGAVEVRTRESDAVRLHPNNLVKINSGAVSELVYADASEFISWTDGVINLYGKTVAQVASHLEDYYGISIICSPRVAGTKLYGKLQLGDDYQKVLKYITYLSDATYSKQGTIIKIKK